MVLTSSTLWLFSSHHIPLLSKLTFSNSSFEGPNMLLSFHCCCYLVAKSCQTLCSRMDCSPPGSFIYGISQARILEWVAISFPEDLQDSRIEPVSPALAGRFFTTEPPRKLLFTPYPSSNKKQGLSATDPKSILKHPLPSSLSSLLFPAFVSLLMQKTVNFFYCYYLKIWKECN